MTISAKFKKHKEELEQSFEYQAYLKVQEQVFRMKEWANLNRGGADSPSRYWEEELGTFDYMFDASPLVIRKLRHHCYPITGIRPYDYRSSKQMNAEGLRARLEQLKSAGDSSLVIPEARELGGFGFEIDGQLFNMDTLKFTEVLMGLDRFGILNTLRKGEEKPLVLEIGSGWGGFAYQFKKVVPRATYLMVDLPEVFLYSGVYLQALYPSAQFYFFDPETFEKALSEWARYDFIFIPNTAWEALPALPVTAAINMVSFQEMTTEQVRNYVRRLQEMRCPSIYSLNRDCSSNNPQITNVREILGECYSLETSNILPTSYTQAAKVKKTKTLKSPVKESDYHHACGFLSEKNPSGVLWLKKAWAGLKQC